MFCDAKLHLKTNFQMENEETEISTPPNAPPHRQTEMEPNKILFQVLIVIKM